MILRLLVFCLITVVAATEGDVICMNLLVENKIIGITSSNVPWRIFSLYLYFNVNHLSSMLDVCEIIELSIHMEEQSISNARYWFSICFADDVYVRWAEKHFCDYPRCRNGSCKLLLRIWTS
jgi:hypothetical protein